MTTDIVLNPFGSVPEKTSGASTAQMSDAARSVAEVQAALMIARMNPRDPIKAMDRVINACTRSSLADAAIYSFPRGRQEVTGPSIRLAEAIAQNWGNIQFGIRELSSSNGKSEVQAYAWDVETNTRREVTFTVPHIRFSHKGSTKLEDPRDIYETVANQGSRRLRACILAVIPGDVVETAVEQCRRTQTQHVDMSEEKISAMVDAFNEKFGVKREQIEDFIRCRITSVRPAQVIRLRQIFRSLLDGMSTPANWFKPLNEDKAIEAKPMTLKEKLKEKVEAEKEEPTPDPEPLPDLSAGTED
ncbi:hypothetical protein [Dakarella massiliensis]|uniref:hypothetical protein n=1 Tax=Dakarella massiliensis TaxID=1506471 RepID=UPI003A938363